MSQEDNENSSEYNELKQHLLKLNYHENFTSESIPLIKRLLNGLYTITENYQILHSHSQKVEKEKWELHCQVEPLKRSLAAITKENNQLHVDLIQKVEDNNKELIKNKFLIRKYEKENMDLKFLNSQYLIQTQLTEKKFLTERRKIEELLTIYNDTNSTNNNIGKGSKKNGFLELVLESIEMDEVLDPMPDEFDVITPPNPQIVDIVRQSQKIIKELEQSNKKLSDKEKNLQEQIVSREKEIARLGSLLINKRSGKFGASSSSDANSKVQQLESQLEYLQEYVIGLEQDITDLEKEKTNIIKETEEEKQEILEELRDAREKDVKLLNELQKLEHLVNELGETNTHSWKKNKIKVTLASILSNNKEELQQELGQSIQTLSETTNTQFKIDFENISNENDHLRRALDKANNEIETLRKDLQSTTDRLRELYRFVKEGIKPLNIQANNENVMTQTSVENIGSKELESLKQEKNDLLEQFQRELEEVKAQSNIEKEQITSITKERNNFEDLYKQLNLKLQTQSHSSTSMQQTLEKLQKTETELASLKLDLESQQSSGVNKNSNENKCEALEAKVEEAKKVVQNMEQELSSIRDRLQQVNQKLIEREKAFENLKKENDEIIIERDKLLAELQYLDQYDSALDDITKVTKGSKILIKLTEVTKNRNQLLVKLEEKENHVKYLNNLIVTKDQEKEILMGSYHKLLNEQQNTSQNNNNLKMEIFLRDRKAQQLQKTLEEEIKHHKAELLNYERRCDILTRMLESVQRDLAQSESERASLLREVSTSHALSSTLDNAKSQLQKRITEDQLAEITDNKSVNIVMEKLGEVQDENKYLKQKMEFLEVQLQGKQTDRQIMNNLKSYQNNIDNNANTNFSLGVSTSDELSSKGVNSNLGKLNQFDFGLSSLNNVREDITSFPFFGNKTNQLTKESSIPNSILSSSRSSLPKSETQNPQIHQVQDNERLMNTINTDSRGFSTR
ncbi:centrosomal protein of 135 kDa isoform X1 [Rhizophagus irregularis DAOM 181602=DAOM 197198]|nr:centrosomal protein of 135 kDa isoform X1 [Rhizophagus irregularis DAOM 181602=DAOM 197198]